MTMKRAVKTYDTIELVVSKDGEPERTETLRREQFRAAEWLELSRNAGMNEVFGRGVKLHGGDCNKEFGGCGTNKIVRIWSKQTGPECILIKYRCLGCGREDDDVMD